jgi:hypothetical protein
MPSSDEEKIRAAVQNTEILRLPKQNLSTFGTTNIHYYLVAEPAYSEIVKEPAETVIREGRVIAERPRLVTPYYLSRVQGFSSEARRYFEMLLANHEPNAPGLFYAYRNEPKEFNIVSDAWTSVVQKLNADIDQKGDTLTSIIKGEDTLWDVSIMKFIYELTRHSIPDNVAQLGNRGLLAMDSSGVPQEARARIEGLFRMVETGDLEPAELKAELDRWNIFREYEDRFFAIFKKR